MSLSGFHRRSARTWRSARLLTCFTDQREPDLSAIEGTVASLVPRLRPGQFVVLVSTTYPGTTEERVRPALENIYRAVNIALVNELKVCFDRMGLHAWEGSDVALIVTDHTIVDYAFVVRHAPLVVDTRNATRDVLDGRERIRDEG